MKRKKHTPDEQDQAVETQTGELLADRVGDKWFAVRDRGYWWRVKRGILTEKICVRVPGVKVKRVITKASETTDPRNKLDALKRRTLAALAKAVDNALSKPTSKPVLEAFLGACEKSFETLCAYVGWLLPRVLEARLIGSTEAAYREALSLLFTPMPDEDPARFAQFLAAKDSFLCPLTEKLFNDDEFRDALLLLYFVYSTPVRATKDDKATRRPLFNALRELGLYFSARSRRLKLQDVIACHHERIEKLRGLKRAEEVFKLAGLEMDSNKLYAEI